MESALRLILPQLSIALIIGAEFLVNQPKSLEAVEGDSITIPCSFTYPETYRPTVINICWRRNEFHGEFIFNKTNSYIHPDYRGRIEFLGHPFTEKTGSIRIKLLKQSDSRRYFCRVEISWRGGSKMWQNIPGTTLSVRERSLTTRPTNAQSNTVNHQTAAKGAGWLIGCGVLAVLVIGLGVIAGVCIWKKKSKDIRQEGVQHIPVVADYQSKNMDQDQKDSSNQSHPTNAAAAKDEDSAGVVYATLQVKERSPTKSRVLPSGENILYADVRFQAETN